MYFFFFFFSSRRRHTRLQGDWSSDVCSSDLPDAGCPAAQRRGRGHSGRLCFAYFPLAKQRSEEHTSELQSPCNLVCRLLLEKKKTNTSAISLPRPSRARPCACSHSAVSSIQL